MSSVLNNSQIRARYDQTYGRVDARLAFKNAPIAISATTECKQSKPSFNEISIFLQSIYDDGFGDLMGAVKLAKGLSREFPDKKVVLYFEAEKDYFLLCRLYPNLDQEKKENYRDGVSFVLSGNFAEEIKGKDISIFAHLKLDIQLRSAFQLAYSPGSRFFNRGAINFYIPEYDAEHLVSYPKGFTPNLAHIDKTGNIHLAVTTGFGIGSGGIHLDDTLVSLYSGSNKRAEYLKTLFSGNDSLDLEDLASRKWGVVYYPSYWAPDKCQYQRMICSWAATSETANVPKSVFFNFQKYFDKHPFTWEDYVRAYDPDNLLFHHVFLGKDGMRSAGNPESKLMLVSAESGVSHSLLMGFMAQSDFPVNVTGDSSLSEAISLSKIFYYSVRSHKSMVVDDIISRVTSVLHPPVAEKIKKALEYHSPEDIRYSLPASYFERAREFQNNYENSLYATASRLFYDPEYISAFKAFNDHVQGKLNLVKNIANLLREAISVYLGAHS